MAKSLEDLRMEIDKIDEDLLEVLVKRMSLSLDVAQAKGKSGTPLFRPDREQNIIDRIKELNSGRVPDRYILPIFREIIGASLHLQGNFQIGYFGEPGSFTHMSARKKFGGSYDFRPFRTIDTVFSAVDRDEIRYGVVPLENTTEGMVNITLDALLAYDLNIYSEVLLPIQQSLLGFADDFSAVKKIITHPQGYAQTRKWLTNNIPQAEWEEYPSTSAAVKYLSETKRKDMVAVGPKTTSEVYGVPILRENITDYDRNFTRFIVISKEEALPSERDRTIISFNLPDKSGALVQTLEPFYQAEINMTSIESRPEKTKIWSYVFFLDFEGHKDNEKIKPVLDKVRKQTGSFRVLGSYPVDATRD